MKKFSKYQVGITSILVSMLILASCEKFFNPKEELNIKESDLYKDWYEYRSVEMGLYSLQQKLAEQLLILGELRGDLLTITPNADADLVEVNNFTISKTNKYASPTNFFKLIASCNNFLRILRAKHPGVIDPKSPVNNYDKLYGEALCMRAWAYFNAVRIYGKVPYIPESLATMDEIEKFVNSSGTYIDSVYITFNTDGYHNDTVHNQPIILQKQMYDQDMVIDVFTRQLENEVKAVGVNHYIDNNDVTWEITIWNDWALHALLGVMYLTRGNLFQAHYNFEKIMKNSTSTYRYQVDFSFANINWRNIFSNIDNREHIYTIWFNKANFQQNQFQDFFEPWAPHKYMLKPSDPAISKWENVWRGQVLTEDFANPSRSRMLVPGFPGDFYRGYMTSFLYFKNGVPLEFMDWFTMLQLRSKGDDRGASAIMDGAQPMVFKYSINKDRYDQDANFIIYRAGGIHLYMAEVYTYWVTDVNGLIKSDKIQAQGIVNDGSYYDVSASRLQAGIRGRVGLGSGGDAIKFTNIVYIHDPYTNKITDYTDFSGKEAASQHWYEEQILDERARELAFEGERFYDLMRVAKRRNDPSFLAKIVSSKYPEGQRQQIYNLLLNEDNWYINYFK